MIMWKINSIISVIMLIINTFYVCLFINFALINCDLSSSSSSSSSENRLNDNDNIDLSSISAAAFTASSGESPLFDDNIHFKINWLTGEHLLNRPELLLDFGEQMLKNGLEEDKIKSYVQDEESLWITTKNKEKYFCRLPQLSSQHREEEKSNEVNLMTPYQLLKPLMTRKVCSYRLDIYWTYELCHGLYLRQFHEESAVQKTNSQEYYLGYYDADLLKETEKEFEAKLARYKEEGQKRPTVQVEGVALPYIELNMTKGTPCDLNGLERHTRVMYVCSEDSKHELFSIKETSTCEYEVIVLSPLLCFHSDFKAKKATELTINCYAIGDAPPKPTGVAELEKIEKPVNDKSGNLYEQKIIIIDKDMSLVKTTDLLNKMDNMEKKLIKFDEEMFREGINNIIREGKLLYNEDKKFDPQSVPVTGRKPADSEILRSFLSGDLCLSGGTGWWHYEFCYGKRVTQYHEERKSRATIVLGLWDQQDHIKWLKENPLKRHKATKTPKQVSHFYGNGDKCPVNGLPRNVEVKLKCMYDAKDLETVALRLLEPKICEYALLVESPLICDLLNTIDENGLFQLPKETVKDEL